MTFCRAENIIKDLFKWGLITKVTTTTAGEYISLEEKTSLLLLHLITQKAFTAPWTRGQFMPKRPTPRAACIECERNEGLQKPHRKPSVAEREQNDDQLSTTPPTRRLTEPLFVTTSARAEPFYQIPAFKGVAKFEMKQATDPIGPRREPGSAGKEKHGGSAECAANDATASHLANPACTPTG